MTHQQNQSPDTETTTTTATTWDLDPSHTGVGFQVKHMMFSSVRGRFGTVKATLELDAEDPRRSRVEAEIDVSSIDTASPDRDAHLASADFFDAAEHPKIVFRSTRIEPVDEERARVIGDLTIRGVTREVVLDVVRDGIGPDPWGNTRAAFSVTGALERDAFGLTWNQLLETGGVLVGNTIRLDIQAQFVQRKQE